MPEGPIENYGKSTRPHEEQMTAQSILINFEDLVGTCTHCGGTGQEPQESASPQSTNTYGRRVIGSTGTPCLRCVGRGKILTPQGEVFARFIDLLESKGAHRQST